MKKGMLVNLKWNKNLSWRSRASLVSLATIAAIVSEKNCRVGQLKKRLKCLLASFEAFLPQLLPHCLSWKKPGTCYALQLHFILCPFPNQFQFGLEKKSKFWRLVFQTNSSLVWKKITILTTRFPNQFQFGLEKMTTFQKQKIPN